MRLDGLGLRDGVRDVKRRVGLAVSEFTDEERRPIVKAPGALYRAFGPALLRLAPRAR